MCRKIHDTIIYGHKGGKMKEKKQLSSIFQNTNYRKQKKKIQMG